MESAKIDREVFSENPLSFESLRTEAINLVQAMSGALWTDYNESDPGVTLLEALCFGLTDVIYRSSFDIKTLLADVNGHIPYEDLGLTPPDQILSSRPTTIEDYCSMFLNEIPELKNIWLEVDIREGVYSAKVELHPLPECGCNTNNANMERFNDVKQQLKKVFCMFRNIGEDFGAIDLLEEQACTLKATINIDDPSRADEIAANIYSIASGFISHSPRFLSYSEVLKKGLELDSIFEGPLLNCAYINFERSAGSLKPTVNTSKLVALIETIECVSGANHLVVVIPKGCMPEGILKLDVPKSKKESGLIIQFNGSTIKIDWSNVGRLIEQSYFDTATASQHCRDMNLIFTMPQGVSREPDGYASIQPLLPEVYHERAGLDKQGNSSSAQLKSYMLIFEQFLANFGSNITGIDSFFSINSDVDKSYFYQILNSAQLSGVEDIYSPNVSKYFDGINRFQDDYWARKSRVADFLLSLYGEVIPSTQYDHLRDSMTPSALVKYIVMHKLSFLSNIVPLTRDRVSGINYLDGSSDHCSGFQNRLRYSLGISTYNPSLTSPAKQINSKIYGSCSSVMAMASFEVKKSNDAAQLSTGINIYSIVEEARYQDITLKECFSDIKTIIDRMNNTIPEALLIFGGNLNRYKVVHYLNKNEFELVFEAEEPSHNYLIGRYIDKISAESDAKKIAYCIARLYLESDGFYVVEHVLLDGLPETQSKQEISVFFPTWNAFTQYEDYKQRVTRIVQGHCPSHILANCYWLNFTEMVEFEGLYHQWRLLKAQADQYVQQEDNADSSDLHTLEKWLITLKSSS